MVHQSLANRPAVPSHKVPSQKLPKGMQQTVGRDKEIEALKRAQVRFRGVLRIRLTGNQL